MFSGVTVGKFHVYSDKNVRPENVAHAMKPVVMIKTNGEINCT
jgi:hypothetical protein